MILSNCVINLVPDKAQVFREAFRALKPGGRLAISDVVNQAPLPAKLKDDPALLCGCIAGAATVQETETWLAEAGFVDVRVTPKAESRELISTWAPGSGIEDFVVSAIVEGRKPAPEPDPGARGRARSRIKEEEFMTSLANTDRRRSAPALGTFERYLTVWVALCIVAGIILGQLFPAPFQALGRMNVAEVNIPVAVLIWLMIVPMLLKVDFGALAPGRRAMARHCRDGRHQLADQALQHGAARLAVYRLAVPPLAAGRDRSTATSRA